MVKKYFLLMILIISIPTDCGAQPQYLNYSAHDFYGAYKINSFKKLPECFPSATQQKAQINSKKKVILNNKKFIDIWGEVKNPSYHITQLTPEREEIVYPKYLQRLFEINGTYYDQITFLSIRDPAEDYFYERLEIIDEHTLLLEDGCWVYTLKRIK